MNTKRPTGNCALVLIADGFDEVEAISILSTLRDAGIYVKSVGLTSGLINGLHGIPLMPDYTVADLPNVLDLSTVNVVVLPGDKRSFAKLEPDPRVHRILRRVIGQEGFVATNMQGYQVLKNAFGLDDTPRTGSDDRILLRKSLDEPVDTFAQAIVRRLG